MGSGFSALPDGPLTKEQVQAFAGDSFDEAAFDKMAKDGTVTKEQVGFMKDIATIKATKESNPGNRMAKHFDEAFF